MPGEEDDGHHISRRNPGPQTGYILCPLEQRDEIPDRSSRTHCVAEGISCRDRNPLALPLEARKRTLARRNHGFRGQRGGREPHATNRKEKLIGQSPHRGGQSERRTAPSLSNVAPAFQNRTLPGRQGRGGRRGRRAPCVPRVRRRIPARQPLRTGTPLRLRAGGGGSAAEGSRLAFPQKRGRPGAGVGAPVEEVKGRGYWKLPRDLSHLPNRASCRLGT